MIKFPVRNDYHDRTIDAHSNPVRPEDLNDYARSFDACAEQCVRTQALLVETEFSREYWKQDAKAAWDKCEERRLENERLEQTLKAQQEAYCSAVDRHMDTQDRCEALEQALKAERARQKVTPVTNSQDETNRAKYEADMMRRCPTCGRGHHPWCGYSESVPVISQSEAIEHLEHRVRSAEQNVASHEQDINNLNGYVARLEERLNDTDNEVRALKDKIVALDDRLTYMTREGIVGRVRELERVSNRTCERLGDLEHPPEKS